MEDPCVMLQHLGFRFHCCSSCFAHPAPPCCRSLFFFATTGYSSMAGMVIQQRHALGMPRNATITFDQLGSLDPDSWPEPWSGTET